MKNKTILRTSVGFALLLVISASYFLNASSQNEKPLKELHEMDENELQAELEMAVANEDYEKAAVIRDLIQATHG